MLALIAIVAMGGGEVVPSVDDIVQRGFEDAAFRARVVSNDQRELRKIHRDFAMPYQFQYTDVRIKEPFMLRVEAKVEDTSLVFVLNGAMRLYRVPGVGSNKEDIADAPGKRQTVMDFGILSPALFDKLFGASYVGRDRDSGDLIFDISYQRADDSRHRLWVNREKRFITKREWFNQENQPVATFIYENPKQDSGIWFPTRVTVKNAEGKTAAVTEYQNLKINRGILDSIFRVE